MAAYDLIVSPKLSAGASAGVYAATSLTNALVQRSAVPAAFFGLYGQTNIGNSFYNTVKAANVDLGPASRQSMEDLSYLFSQRRAVVAGPIKWFSVSRDQVPSEGLEEYDRTTLTLNLFYNGVTADVFSGSKGVSSRVAEAELEEGDLDGQRRVIPHSLHRYFPLLHIAPGFPPSVLVHGEGDSVIPWTDSKVYGDTVRACRIQHEDMPRLKASGQPVLAPSAVPAAGGKFRELPGSPGHSQHVTAIDDVNRIVEQYRTAARLAKDAGFDGIELLSQGGYLLHNFLCSHSNLRTDDYGGSVENRCRFPLQVLDAILDVWPASLVGIKICPSDDYNDSCVSYEELSETYTYYIKQLMSRQLGYINLSRRGCTLGRVQDDDYFVEVPRPKGKELPRGYEPIHQFGALVKYPGSPTQLMVNHEYSTEEAEQLLAEGKVDLVTFGRPFIYNPDLVSRIKTGAELALNTRGKNVNYGPYGKPDDFYNDWPTASL
ncbi:hypothetical protein MNV49_000751 [Pseudohyphozyma bogoriensis]|nr:hypothetical protein MNV49_000751 [Pseudohyphozyma bogoriensis]